MPILHAIILGVIQGLTEILPISSSAHLVIVPWVLKWPYQGLDYDVALHVGTALAILAYFFKDWVDIIKSAFGKSETYQKNILLYIIVATIPAAALGLIFENLAETIFRSPLVIISTLFIFAVILYLADRFGKKEVPLRKISVKTSIFIGFAQALALIPGVSRSGITITAGLYKGLSREAAAKFSFLLATPIIISAGILELSKLSFTDLNLVFWTGVVASAVSGFITINFLLNFVKKSSMNLFVIYRICLAVFMLILFLARQS